MRFWTSGLASGWTSHVAGEGMELGDAVSGANTCKWIKSIKNGILLRNLLRGQYLYYCLK